MDFLLRDSHVNGRTYFYCILSICILRPIQSLNEIKFNLTTIRAIQIFLINDLRVIDEVKIRDSIEQLIPNLKDIFEFIQPYHAVAARFIWVKGNKIQNILYFLSQAKIRIS